MRFVAACAALALAGAVTGCTVQVPGVAQTASPGPSASAGRSPEPSGGVGRVGGVDAAYADAEGRFTFVPPPGWTVDTTGAMGIEVAFVDPQPSESPTGRLSANVNVFVAPSVAELPATVVGAREELLAIPGYASTTDEPVTLADGTPAHLIGGTFTDPGTGFALRNVQLVTVHDGRTTVVTGTSLREVWNRYEQTFQTSLRSLTVGT